jgi:uroporphyrinogen III methyltransferase / synthase
MEEPLAGRTIVVTRASSQAGDFSNTLEAYGATVISCPTIEIAEPESYERLDEAIDHLYGYDWIIFTSANGVEYFLRRLQTRDVGVEEPSESKNSTNSKSARSAKQLPTNSAMRTFTSI